ncbi:hypothetical protein [Hyphomicrobium methylovorum]|uniref:hypothetical protein n=1 Tax=Hyphomicrobium methylovorum TaxID=84 RepID=UPI0015E69EEE|nr:hypothetical protein [Hyphomicrobium methylovorum]
MPEIRYCNVSELTEDERWRLATEVEARNTARRMSMTDEERRQNPPWKTEDVPEERQIVLRKR